MGRRFLGKLQQKVLFQKYTTIFTVVIVAHLSYINISLTKSIVMSKKTATVRARMEPELKKETERILNQLRSEEHTSELQSRGHLVCRLLLEKKNKEIKPLSE